MKNQKGFSLIELLIVVVIIGIIAAIAIPNLLASRRAANEGSAISSLRTIHGAQMTYSSTTGNGSFASLTGLAGANLIDAVLGKADTDSVKSGYKFSSEKTDSNGGTSAKFAVKASPVTEDGVTQTGTRSFGISTPGVIYSGAPAAATFSITNGDLSGTSKALDN